MVIGRFTRTRTTSATNLSLLLLSNDMVAAVAVVSGRSPTSPLPPPPVPGLHLGHTMEDVMGKFNHFNYYHYERDKFLFVGQLGQTDGRELHKLEAGPTPARDDDVSDQVWEK